MSIAITGASGQLGRRTAELLLDKADPADVVLVTRSPEKLADLEARGASVRAGDFTEPESLIAAFAGVEKLLLVSTDVVDGRGAVQNRAVDVAVAAGVKQIAFTSVVNPVGNPALVSESHLETEEALKASGLAWTLLRNNIYADQNLPTIENAIATGTLVTNAGDGAVSYVTREDCALAAVAYLTTDGHAGKSYEITGPEAITATDLAALASELSNKEIGVVKVSDAEYVRGLVDGAGLPEPLAEIIASIGRAAREGYMAEISPAVEQLTGRAPSTLASLTAAVR